MKRIATTIAAGILMAAFTMAQTQHYTVIDLGSVGAAPGQPYFIASNGLVSGAAALAAGRPMHAVLWNKGQKLDIGAPGLGGSNSVAFGVNDSGRAVGQAETTTPNGEDFCGFNAYGFPSFTACLPFLWQNGGMIPLPTLGGANGTAKMINNRGQVAGYAENTTQDQGCPVLQFKPVVWENRGTIQELPTYPGDAVGAALGINDNGQVVGISGPCAAFNPNLGLYLLDSHALLWQDGKVTDLGNLGGDGGFGGNHACAINNQGEVVGHSDLTGDTTFHAYLWTRKTGMRDLGTLPGDFASLAIGINDRSQVVGASLDSSFNPRAVLWENGKATDLNTPGLIRVNPAGLYLLFAYSINSAGEIVGFGVAADGLHGFLATPNH